MMTPAITCDVLGSADAFARPFRGTLRTAIIAAILLWSAPSPARPAQTDRVAAEALFQEGRKLVKQGDYATACPKFEASFALYPAAGTMINIGDCHRNEGKLATAWSDYRRALDIIRQSPGEERQDQKEIAMQELRALEPRLPKLRIVIKNRPAELKVLRDGRELPASALGEALVADPGRVEVRASAPGHRPETRLVELEEGKTTTVELSLAATAVDAGAPGARTDQGGVPAWAWATGGAGIALAGAAVGFLVDDLNAISNLRSSCHTNASGTYCAPGYDHARDNARKNRSVGLFLGLGVASVVSLGAATLGIVRAHSSKGRAEKVAVGLWGAPGQSGMTMSGSF